MDCLLCFLFVEVDQVHIIERAFSSALLALVTEYKPRHLNLYDIRLGNEIGDATIFPTNILAVKMSQSVKFTKKKIEKYFIHFY